MEEFYLGKVIADRGYIDSGEALEIFLDFVASKNIELYPAQEEGILEIFAGKNVILNTPTGSGKSLVALATHFKSLTEGRRSVYTSPIKALVNEKFISLCKEFGPDLVGMLTGDGKVNENAPILLCTAEILANMALRDGDQANVDDVIIDEFHYYADRERGVSWQIPLLTLPQSRFLLMSATIGDPAPFAEALNKLNHRETTIVSSTQRPVPLAFSYSEIPLEKTVEDLLERNLAPVYIVNFTQREAAENSQNFLSLNFCSKEEKKAIAESITHTNFGSPYGKEIKKLIKHGIGIHHGGLLPKYRILIETLAQTGKLKIICGTDTLGVGVNVPIRTVLFTKLCKYDGEKTGILSARDFHQIAGRSGRKGFDDRGYVVCQAPEHVIENKKLEAKAKLNPKKKFVKAKPPEKGYVGWTEETFLKLIDAQPEKLQSRFQMTHSLLLNVLSRKNDGCHAMKDILHSCHESEKSKARLRKLGMQMFRSLLERQIVAFIPKEKILAEGLRSKISINVDLQEDFSLTQSLSLYFLDTIALLDPFSDDYDLKLLSLVESIIENPDLILHRQLDQIKREKIFELKEQGLDFEERNAKLEELEYPKPEKEFIYATYNEFAAKHPWMPADNIRPKSIARQMYENYQSFGEYIQEYGLERVEGLLLRYLSNVYKVLLQTVPYDLKNDAIDDMVSYFETIIKTTDSSIVDEWERLKNPGWTPKPMESLGKPKDAALSIKALSGMVRNTVFLCLRALSRKNYANFLDLIFQADEEKPTWTEKNLIEKLAPFYAERSRIQSDANARNSKNLRIIEEKGYLDIELTLCDDLEFNDWSVFWRVDIELARYEGSPRLELIDIRQI